MQQPNDPTQPPAAAPQAPTADAPPHSRRPRHDEPEHIGLYRILERMGEGGMGIVYKAEQREPVRRIVALKVIKLGMDTKEVIARFEAERQALALMSHPNVAKVFEAGMTEQGRPFFAMEFVAGVPLNEYCDDNKLTTRERLELFVQVCHAVQHAHQKGIIHRDLKPSNILVTMFDGKPVPKVIDFGIAKAANQALTQRTLYTQTGALIGTPEYMSPEQAQTSGLDVDTRTDIYSLGVILYELLTGELPFDAVALRSAGMDGMARIIKETEPQKPSTRLSLLSNNPPTPGHAPDDAAKKRRCDPRSLVRELRGDLDWITLKAMEKDRTRRYDTAVGLAMDIKRYLENEPIFARPPSTLYRLGKSIRKHKVGFVAVAAVALALVLGVITTSVEMIRARAATARAVEAERVAVEQRRIAEQQRAVAMENEAKADYSVAHLLQIKGDFAGAEPLMRRTLEVYQQLRGPEHVDVAAAMGNLGSLLQAKRDFPAAEQVLRQSLAMYQRIGGEQHPGVAGAYVKLGELYLDEGQVAAAEPLLRRSIEIYRAAKTPEMEGLAAALGDLGLLLMRGSKDAVAEPLLHESMENWMKVPGYESVMSHDIAAIALILSRLHEQRGDQAGTRRYFRQYLLIQVAHIGMGLAANPNDSSFRRSRADMAAKIGRFQDAAADLDKFIQLSPEEHVAYMQDACIHLYIGDEAGYRDLCQRMLQRFGKSTDARVHDRIAKTCFAAPGALNDLAPVLQMARANVSPEVLKNVPGAQDVAGLFTLCAAMAEYRAGNYQRVIDLLNNLMVVLVPTPHNQQPSVPTDTAVENRLSIEPRATAVLFRAMAKYRLHHEDEARRELERAHSVFKRISAPDADVIDPDATLQDWLICQIARREADALIGGQK